MKKWFGCVAVMLAILCVVPARADDVEQARAEFWQGNEAFALHDYRRALEHFELAYELAPNPRLLEYMARCHAEVGDYGLAIQRLELLVEQEPESAEELRASIEELRVEMVVRAVDMAVQEVDGAVARARGEQPQPINQLRQRLGTAMRDVPVQILSDPRGAEVYIDGVEFGAYGITPLTTPLFTGPHLIEIRKPYYEPVQQILNVTVPGPGESIPVVNARLRRQEVPVDISVVPLTANVTFLSDTGERRSLGAGGYSGVLPAGPCTFIVQNAGRDRRVEQVLELPEGESTLAFTLHLDNQQVRQSVAVEIGLLRVVTQMVDGSVWVDGRRVGDTPGTLELDLPAGPHTVEVRRDGYTPFAQSVDVQPGSPTVLYVPALERARRR